MQIKKFEARTMKEALEMVKTQLGPDAVILSAKEVNKGFGLGGVKSIEITAAYSETVLQNKKIIENRMPEHLREQFIKAPARLQKQTIQKAFTNQLEQIDKDTQAKKPVFPSNMTQRRYADIETEESTVMLDYNKPLTQSQASINSNYNQFAKKAIGQQGMIFKQNVQQQEHNQVNAEVDQLKNEIEQLKSLLTQFKTMPQSYLQAHPGADYGLNYNLSGHFQKLTRKGLLPEIAAEILIQAQAMIPLDKQANAQVIEAFIAKYVLKTTAIQIKADHKFHLFMGPSGSGKTTSMIKYASNLVLSHKKRVALISTDTIKIGADEQMKIFSQILNLPYISVRSQADWYKILPYLNQVDHILVDFASLNLKSSDEYEYLKNMMPPVTESVINHLVLSATAKDTDLIEIHKKYKSLNVSDIIFTNLDEASVHGNIYNFSQKTKEPLFAFGIGPKTPEDFERASAERVLDLILNITQTQLNNQDQNI
ncbi:MAG: flagellar biosynthesis protein FlhF [Pseudobdellovibrio sp.]